MATWIFQCNPDGFDVDRYLAFAAERIAWQVNQSWNQISQGDQVFLWRAMGRGQHGPAGIVAECRVDSPVLRMADDPASRRFWRDQSGVDEIRRRVWLRVVRVAAPGSLLSRELIRSVPELSGLGPIGFGQSTNYGVNESEVGPLNVLWQNAVTPRTSEDAEAEVNEASDRLEAKTLEELQREYSERTLAQNGPPRKTLVAAPVFERDPYVRAISRKRAQYRCEVPNCTSEVFVTSLEKPYCEVHHILPLASGGTDTLDNTACVCANHHRELHVGVRSEVLTRELRRIRLQGE